jgi:hypothetical protein
VAGDHPDIAGLGRDPRSNGGVRGRLCRGEWALLWNVKSHGRSSSSSAGPVAPNGNCPRCTCSTSPEISQLTIRSPRCIAEACIPQRAGRMCSAVPRYFSRSRSCAGSTVVHFGPRRRVRATCHCGLIRSSVRELAQVRSVKALVIGASRLPHSENTELAGAGPVARSAGAASGRVGVPSFQSAPGPIRPRSRASEGGA